MKIAIVEDNDALRDTLELILRSKNFQVSAFDSAESFLANLGHMCFDVLLTDFELPGITGLDLVQNIRRRSMNTSCILMSGTSNPDIQLHAINSGCVAFLRKPFEFGDLFSLL